jgi:two-component system sensor histidine kinase PilS (NtrC family)
MTREARRVAIAQDTALVRVYRTYAAARAVVGLLLVLAQAAGGLLGVRLVLASTLLCIAYAVQAITFWLLPSLSALKHPPAAQPAAMRWLATIGVDLAVFAALHVLEAGRAASRPCWCCRC